MVQRRRRGRRRRCQQKVKIGVTQRQRRRERRTQTKRSHSKWNKGGQKQCIRKCEWSGKAEQHQRSHPINCEDGEKRQSLVALLKSEISVADWKAQHWLRYDTQKFEEIGVLCWLRTIGHHNSLSYDASPISKWADFAEQPLNFRQRKQMSK
jgi:hypothetical protein